MTMIMIVIVIFLPQCVTNEPLPSIIALQSKQGGGRGRQGGREAGRPERRQKRRRRKKRKCLNKLNRDGVDVDG